MLRRRRRRARPRRRRIRHARREPREDSLVPRSARRAAQKNNLRADLSRARRLRRAILALRHDRGRHPAVRARVPRPRRRAAAADARRIPRRRVDGISLACAYLPDFCARARREAGAAQRAAAPVHRRRSAENSCIRRYAAPSFALSLLRHDGGAAARRAAGARLAAPRRLRGRQRKNTRRLRIGARRRGGGEGAQRRARRLPRIPAYDRADGGRRRGDWALRGDV